MKNFISIMAGMILSPIILVLGLGVLFVLFLANMVELIRAVILFSSGRGWDFHFWTAKDIDFN